MNNNNNNNQQTTSTTTTTTTTTTIKNNPIPLFIIHNTKQITCVLFSNTNNNCLYVGTRDGEFYIYNLNIRRPVCKLSLDNQSITNIIEFNENKIYAYLRNGSVIEIIRFKNDEFKSECVYQNDNYSFCNMCLLAEKNLIFLPSNQNSIIDCINLNDFNKIFSLEPKVKTDKYGMLMCIKVINNELLLASYENGDLALFDINKFCELSRLSLFKGYPLLSFDYSIDKNIGIAGCSELDLKQFKINNNDFNNYYLETINDSICLKNPGLNKIKIRNFDNKIFAFAGWDSKIRLYSLKKAKLLCVLDFHNENVNTLDFSNNNSTLVCGSNDGLISFWKLY